MTRYHVRSITVLELYRRPEPRLRVMLLYLVWAVALVDLTPLQICTPR